MSQAHEASSAATPAHLRHLVEQFEQAWQNGPAPVIEKYLSPDPRERRWLLIELVRIDLERRLKRGEAVRVESYLRHYPELADQATVVLDLIQARPSTRARPPSASTPRMPMPTTTSALPCTPRAGSTRPLTPT